MNNFKTDINGGLPFRLDDLRFITAAQMEAFKGLVQSLIGDIPYAILNGCEYSIGLNDLWHFNEGYIYFNNEIFYAPAQDVVNGFTQGDMVWEVDLSYDHSGDKSFLVDGVIHSTYEIRRAKIVAYATQQQGGVEFNIDNVLTILKNRIGVDDSAWTVVPFTSSNVSIGATGTIGAISGNLYYKVIGKTFFARIALNVSVQTADSNTLNIDVTLPSSIVPKQNSELISTVICEDSPAVGTERLFKLFYNDMYKSLTISNLQIIQFEVRTFQFKGEIFFEIN